MLNNRISEHEPETSLKRGDLSRFVEEAAPKHDFVLALAQAGGARYIVTGDKSGLLALRQHAGAEIVTAADFVMRCLN